MQSLHGLKFIAQYAPEQLIQLGSRGVGGEGFNEMARSITSTLTEDSLQTGIMRAYACMLPFILQQEPLSTSLLSSIHTAIYTDNSVVSADNLGKFRGFGTWSGSLFGTYKLYRSVVSLAGLSELLEAQTRGLCHCETAYQKPLHTIEDIEEQLSNPPGYFCVSGYRAAFSWFDLSILQDKLEQQHKLLSSKDHRALYVFTQEEQNKLSLEIQNIFQHWQNQFHESLASIFKTFQRNISQLAMSEHATLHEIVLFIKELLYIHPFFEGNLRSIGVVFCNVLLLRYGFFPAIIEDPFAWRGYSSREMVEKLQQGMRCFSKLIASMEQDFAMKEKPGISIDHLQSLSSSRNFREMVAPLESALLRLEIPAVNAIA